MRFFCADSTNIKIRIPWYLPNPPRAKDQRETKDEPRNDLRTPYHQKVLFVEIALATGLVLGDFPPSITCPFFVYCPAESPITLLAFCLFIISNTIEFSSLHRLYPIARRASYRRSRPITSWRFRAIRSLPITLVHLVLPFPPSVLLSQFTLREFPRFFVCPLSRISFDSPSPITYNL